MDENGWFGSDDVFLFQGEKVFSEPAVNHLPGCQLFQLVTRDWQIPPAYFKGNLG